MAAPAVTPEAAAEAAPSITLDAAAIALKDHAQNAARDAQAKAEGWEFWTNMAEDIASDYANVYELELSFAGPGHCPTIGVILSLWRSPKSVGP